ncbi:MAG: (d)CMP kinase [Oligoflexales bacterium]
MSARPIIVAVDGPAGSGKSSVCAEASRRLQWGYVNTGLVYRAFAYLSSSLSDEEITNQLPRIISNVNEFLTWDALNHQMFYQGENITAALITDQMGERASKLAKLPEVRQGVLELQRKFAMSSPKGVILDGRDIGTVVFPDADVKVFLTASIEERARRRFLQLQRKGLAEGMSYLKIASAMALRDSQDRARKVAPLIQAADAVLLDTSNMDEEQAVANLVEIIHGAIK